MSQKWGSLQSIINSVRQNTRLSFSLQAEDFHSIASNKKDWGSLQSLFDPLRCYTVCKAASAICMNNYENYIVHVRFKWRTITVRKPITFFATSKAFDYNSKSSSALKNILNKNVSSKIFLRFVLCVCVILSVARVSENTTKFLIAFDSLLFITAVVNKKALSC